MKNEKNRITHSGSQCDIYEMKMPPKWRWAKHEGRGHQKWKWSQKWQLPLKDELRIGEFTLHKVIIYSIGMGKPSKKKETLHQKQHFYQIEKFTFGF